MRFKTTVKVLGMKKSVGEYEGTKYDNTRIFIEQALDSSKGDAVGVAMERYEIGTSTSFDRFSKLPFPHEAELEMEIVTTGKVSKTVVHSYHPLTAGARPAGTPSAKE